MSGEVELTEAERIEFPFPHQQEAIGRIVAARVASAAAERDEQIRALAEEFTSESADEDGPCGCSACLAYRACATALRALLDAAPAGGES